MAKRMGGQPTSGTIGITTTGDTSHDESDDKSGLLEQSRNPHTVTDTHTTASAPASGKHAGDGMTDGGGSIKSQRGG